MFYVTDSDGNQLDGSVYGEVFFETEKRAISRAKALSKLYPSEIFGIGCACVSSLFCNGKVVS